MTLERVAVLGVCTMGMGCAHAADPLVLAGGPRPVYSVVANGEAIDGRSFVQRLDGPRIARPVLRPAREAMAAAADASALPPADDPSASESPSLGLMGLGLLATGLVLLRRRPL